MANVGYVANSVVSTPSTLILAIIETNFGHTVTKVAQAAFTSSSFSGQDVIVVGPTDRDDSTFISNLDTHMDTHGVPVVVLMSDGLSADEIGRNGSDAPDTTASALGIIALERRNATASVAANSVALRTESRTHPITDGFGKLLAEDDIILSEDEGEPMSELPEVARADSTVIEVSSNAAGTRLLNNGDGFTILVAEASGGAKVGARTGETFGTNVAWLGLGAGWDDRWGKDAAVMLAVAVDWARGQYANYPTTGTNGWVSPYIDLEPLDEYETSTISWTEVTPASTSITVRTSIDDGATWSAATSGNAIPGLTDGDPLVGVRLLVKAELSTSVTGSTPEFSGLVLTIKGAHPPLRDGSDVIRPDAYFQGGLVTWNTGNNAGLSMEILSWDSSTRTLKLFLPMPQDIQVGDSFDIVPGCEHRFDEDCVTKFGNGVNFRAEPHLPGTDRLVRFPDAQ
jgi:hypothetical protein